MQWPPLKMSPSTRFQAPAGVTAEDKGESSSTLCPRASSLFYQALGGARLVALIEVVWTEVLVQGPTLQQVIASREDGVRHGNDGSLHSTCCRQATKLRGKIAVLGFRRRPGSFAVPYHSPGACSGPRCSK